MPTFISSLFRARGDTADAPASPDAGPNERRRFLLTLGDPSAAISFSSRSLAERLGQTLRLVMGRSPHERLPADMRRLLGDL